MIIAKKRINSDASYRGNMWRIMLARHNLRDLHEQAISDFELSRRAGGAGRAP